MNVPFVDLRIQYKAIKKEIDEAIGEVLDSCAFVLGPAVQRFEEDFASYLGARHCVGMSSGTCAITIALMATGIGAGDEVITVPNSFIATIEPIALLGAKPVFVEVDEATRTMDTRRIEEAITPCTRAIMPVHLYGQPADMDPILEIAKKHNLLVIEDAAQAHGAEYKGQKVGTIGDIGCFSFYPGKNLGAYGEGGMFVTGDDEIAEKARMLRDHGSVKKYHHAMIGLNARMHGIQGAVLGVKLKYLDRWTERRRAHAVRYNELLKDVNVITPHEADYAQHVYHLYTIRTKRREEMLNYLKEKGIGAGIHYPVPLHLEQCITHFGYKKGAFPVTEQLADEILSLPMYPELSDEQIEYVVECVKSSLISVASPQVETL